MSNYLCVALICLLTFAVLWAPPGMGQSLETKTSPDGTEALDQGNVSILAGPSSVGGQLGKDREANGAFYPVPHLSERYFNFKNRIEEEYGFSFGFDYNALFQAASDSLGEDKAAGGVFRAYGQWTLEGSAHANVIWHITPEFLVGAEYMIDERVNANGADETHRIQFLKMYSFGSRIPVV